MTTQLRAALHEMADTTPPFDVTVDPWVQGRRARTRRRTAAIATLAGAGLLIAGLVVGGAPRLSSDPPPAGPIQNEPTLPDRLYDVPRNLPDLRDDPLGGAAAVAYSTATEIRLGFWGGSAAVPLVVGAERDVVRAVRDLAGSEIFALSPDGTRLAAANPSNAEHGWPAVLITDLVHGRTERFELPDPAQGGDVERMVWTPDGGRLVVEAWAVLERLGEGSYRGEDRRLVLDARTGGWSPRTYQAPLAFSPDGRLELRSGETSPDLVIAHTDGPELTTVQMRAVNGVRVEPHDTAAFSPDGEALAVWGSRPVQVPPHEANPHSIELFDVSTGTHLGAVDLGGLGGGGILGWGDSGLLGLVPKWSPGTEFIRFELSDLPDVSQETVVRHTRDPDGVAIWNAAVPTALLDTDVRVAEPPERRWDWVPWLPWLIAAALVVTVAAVRRQRLGRRNREIGA